MVNKYGYPKRGVKKKVFYVYQALADGTQSNIDLLSSTDTTDHRYTIKRMKIEGYFVIGRHATADTSYEIECGVQVRGAQFSALNLLGQTYKNAEYETADGWYYLEPMISTGVVYGRDDTALDGKVIPFQYDTKRGFGKGAKSLMRKVPEEGTVAFSAKADATAGTFQSVGVTARVIIWYTDMSN